MVTFGFRGFMLLAVVTLTGGFWPATQAFAAATATVDRSSVDLNESFSLEVVVEDNIDIEPDWTVLDRDFYRGQVSKMSNTSIINGQIRRSRTWEIVLMAKSNGSKTIPSIRVGNVATEPLTIAVNEPTELPPGEADVFVTSEVDSAETFVQAQVLYRIKIYLAVQTRQAALHDPGITGAEVLVELVGDEQHYDAVLNGRSYRVVERLVAIYPQESGQISISPARFEARVMRDGRITGRKVFYSNAHSIDVRPIPAPPADYPDAAWLPAHSVEISEEWSREPDRLEAGEPVTRHVTISALGQLETQIPALDPPDIEGLNTYADKPDLNRRNEAEGIRGIRKDQYAMIGVAGGTAEIPELAVPWWDIKAGEWRVATLPGREIRIRAVEAAPIETQPEAPPPVIGETEEAVSPAASETPFWKLASQLLAALWLLTGFAWWWSSRDRQPRDNTPRPQPVYKQQAKYVKAARRAAVGGDVAGVRDALREWGLLQWPENPPRSIGELAARVAPPLSEQLAEVSAASYGGRVVEWDGAALSSSLRTIRPADAAAPDARSEPLPPLMPPGA